MKFPSRTESSKSTDSSTVKSRWKRYARVSEILEDHGSRETVEECEPDGSHHEPETEDDVALDVYICPSRIEVCNEDMVPLIQAV